jgi:DNA-binding CsgD family transcriptional regulator
MRPRSPSEPKSGSPQRGAEGPNPDQLICLLAGLALKTESAQEPENCCQSSEEILVDTEFDGFRYLLVRFPKPTGGTRVTLSPREQEIVRMVADGHPNKVIAGVLNISGWTVCTHLRRIFAKLGVGSRAAMVAKLFKVSSVNHRHLPTVAASPSPAVSPAASPTPFEQKPFEQKMSAVSGRR